MKSENLSQAIRNVAERAVAAADADIVLQSSMAAFIELARRRYALDAGAQWKPGRPLKLLLAGYSGTRNTGSDVRVEEMIRQFQHLFGQEHVELSVLSLDRTKSANYFRTARQLHLPQVFPRFLYETVHEHHGVVACEGSMFKSKFANALSTMMVGALGLAAAEYKLAIGYGGEAGTMDPSLERLVKRYCKDALVLTRNQESSEILSVLGISTRLGTDTAWTFEPAPREVARNLLVRAGWDEVAPVLVVCPINPFWWPVKPSITKAAAHRLAGAYSESYYSTIYFHASGEEIRTKQRKYIAALAEGVRRFQEKHSSFVVLVGMEALDRGACEDLGRELGNDVPQFVSDEHDMYTLVSILREAAYIASSRYHAIVTSMPRCVPSVGITMDERIRNLMVDRGQPYLALHVSDPNLGEHLYEALERLRADTGAIQEGIGRCVIANLVRMGQMGKYFVEYVRKNHPEFPFRKGLGAEGNEWAHLPELPADVRLLLERSSGDA